MQVGFHHSVLVHMSQNSTRASAHLLAKEKEHPQRLHQAATCIVVLPLVMGHEPNQKPGRGVIIRKFSSWTCNSFSNCMLDMQFA